MTKKDNSSAVNANGRPSGSDTARIDEHSSQPRTDSRAMTKILTKTDEVSSDPQQKQTNNHSANRSLVMLNAYDYRQKVFTTATFCLELNFDTKMIRKTAGFYGIDKNDLVHACYILRTGSSFLRELVERGFWSFAQARDHIRICFGNSKMRYVSPDSTARFEKQLKDVLRQAMSMEHCDHLLDFHFDQIEDGNEIVVNILEALVEYVNLANYMAKVSDEDDGIKRLTHESDEMLFVFKREHLPSVDEMYELNGIACDVNGNCYYDANVDPITVSRMLTMIESGSVDVD